MYSLLLLIVNVGSVKTTFVRYFQKVFLEKVNPQLAKQCDWVFVNMNQAPLTKDEIYSWIKTEIINYLKGNHDNIEFSSIEVIKQIFRKEKLPLHAIMRAVFSAVHDMQERISCLYMGTVMRTRPVEEALQEWRK